MSYVYEGNKEETLVRLVCFILRWLPLPSVSNFRGNILPYGEMTHYWVHPHFLYLTVDTGAIAHAGPVYLLMDSQGDCPALLW